jgi:hypothetical protein
MVPCLEPNLKRIKNQKLGPQQTTAPCYIQLFSVMEFTLVTVILPDVLSSIPPCGIFFPSSSLKIIQLALPLLKIFMEDVGYF